MSGRRTRTWCASGAGHMGGPTRRQGPSGSHMKGLPRHIAADSIVSARLLGVARAAGSCSRRNARRPTWTWSPVWPISTRSSPTPTIDDIAVKVRCGAPTWPWPVRAVRRELLALEQAIPPPSSPARSCVARASPRSGRGTRGQRHRAGQAAASAGQVHELQLDVVRIAEHQGGVGDRLLHVDHAGVAHPERV